MDRSLAARPPIGRLHHPITFALPRRALWRLCLVLTALALLGGGWLWLRDSPLVTVEHVRITGVQGPDAGSIEAALRSSARRMSTLDVRVGVLRAAVAPFRVVRDLRVSSSFPHGLRIHVVEQLPVAALSVAGVHTAVAADGVVLGPGLLSASLPAITSGSAAGSAAHPPPALSGRVQDSGTLAELGVLGAAPRVLLGWIARVYSGHEGLTVAMRDGLLVYFGDAARPHAKWLAAARVLADPSSAGATYVDVRAPERPAAGTAAAGGLEGSATAAQVSASDPNAAALAGALAQAVGGGSSGAGAGNPGALQTAPATAAGQATSGQAAPQGGAGQGTSQGGASQSEEAQRAAATGQGGENQVGAQGGAPASAQEAQSSSQETSPSTSG